MPRTRASSSSFEASRYHVAASILATGVNLLHVDTDSAFLSDPYALLKSAPLNEISKIILPEAPANGGMWYAQNTSKGSGAAWVMSEVSRRTLRVIELKLPDKRKALPPFDQAMLGDVLYTAADSGRLSDKGATPAHWGAACEHSLLRPTSLCEVQNVTKGGRGMRWARRVKVAPPTEAMAKSLLALVRPGEAPPKELPAQARLRIAELRVAGTDRVELGAASPPWLFPTAWKSQQLGQFARSPPSISVAHLLGVHADGARALEDVDHGAKWEWMHLSGFWPPRSYVLAPPLNASVPGAIASGSVSASQDAAGGGKQRGGVAAEDALSERMEKHGHKRGRARLLYADRPTLLLDRSSSQMRVAEAADDNGATAQALVRRLVLLAALTGRIAVLPSFNCSSKWIKKRQSVDGATVMSDLRVVIVDVANGRPLHEQRCAPCNVEFACREHVLSEAQHAAAREALGRRDAPIPLPLPRRPKTEGSMVVDLPTLWAQLLADNGRLDNAPSLAVSGLADIDGDACTIDAVLLKQARPLAARVSQVHCGVADTYKQVRVMRADGFGGGDRALTVGGEGGRA